MIQFKVFVGTIAEIEQALNAFCAGLPAGVNVNAGPLTPQIPGSVNDADVRQWYKEVMYVLLQRSNVAVPAPGLVRANGKV